MAISIVGGTAVGSASSNVITKPTGVLQGDLILILCESSGSSLVGVPTAPTGFTSLETNSTSGTAPSTISGATWAYKVAGASEPSTWTFTSATGSSFDVWSCIALRGQDATTPIDAHTSNGGTGTSLSLTALTASLAGDALVILQTDVNDVAVSTWPTGVTEYAAASNPTGNGVDTGTELGLGSGTTGTLTVTVGSAPDIQQAAAILVKAPSTSPVNGSATLRGTGGAIDGFGAVGNMSPKSAATPSQTLTGSGALGGGVAGSGRVNPASAATASLILKGAGAVLAGLFAGLGILPAPSGNVSQAGGSVNGAATLLGMGAMLLGFGGHGNFQAQSAATPTQTLKGSGALGDGLSGSGTMSPSSAATPGISFSGEGALGTGQSGSGSLSSSGAATPRITFQGMGALFAGLFAGSGILPPPAVHLGGQITGIFRWLYTAAYNVLQQSFAPRNVLGLGFGNGYNVLQQGFAPRQVQTMVFGGTAYFTMSFVREPDVMVTPNSTIQVVMTAKKFDGTLMSNLTTVTCTVTFPDGTTSSYALGTGITNTGSGTYTLQYTTKMAGENIEDWVGTDASGNTAEYHNITPVSF